MILPEDIQKIFKAEQELNQKAYDTIYDIAKSHHNELGVIVYQAINLNTGGIGLHPCSLHAVLIRDNKLFVCVSELELERNLTQELPMMQSMELLHLLTTAKVADNEYFFSKFPKAEMLKTDADIEKAFVLFVEAPTDTKGVLEEDFMDWEAGTPSETVLDWFDSHHSKGITYLTEIAYPAE